MKILRYIRLILFLIPGLPGLSQITFIADTIVGCDSLEVTFTYINADVIDTVISVEWDFGNGLTATGIGQQVIKYDSAGKYRVSIRINDNTTLPPKFIRVFPVPSAAFWWTNSLEPGSYTVTMVNPPQQVDSMQYSFRWLVEGADAGDTEGIIYTFPDEGEYIAELIVTDEAGCTDTARRMITVMDLLDCPNVFTPNEDGRNDYFVVSSNGLNVYSLKVYSKSGILVYRAEAPLIIWDGRNLSGQELSPGTYFYVIKPAGDSGRFEKTGFVELYR